MKFLIFFAVYNTFFVISTAETSSDSSGYIFTCPRVLSTGTTNELHFQRFGNNDPVQLNVQVLYKETYYSSNETVAAEQTFEVPPGLSDTILHLDVNKIKNTYGGRIQINGTLGKKVISGSDSVDLESPRTTILIIQTDKPMYQPGQKVKFRVLRINKHLQPFESNSLDVYVEDPKGTRLFQFNDLDLSQGIIQREFSLSEEPVEGSWSIRAKSKDQDETTRFDVKEYVLPKFEVNINTPSFVLANAESIPIQICAKYTYGKPVKGTLNLNVSLEHYVYYYMSRTEEEEKYPTLKESVKLDGCYDYSINVSQIEINNEFTGRDIHIKAHIIEAGTGVERDVDKNIYRDVDPINLEFKDQRDNYKPGLPYNGKLFATNPDNTPATEELVEICSTVTKSRIIAEWWSTKKFKMCKNYTSDENGIIHYTVLAKNIDVTSIRLEAKSMNYFSNSGEGRQNSLEQPETSTSLTPFYSPTGSFIQIQPVHQPVSCGTKQNFKILFTSKGNANYKFYYQVIKEADISLVDSVKKSFTLDDGVSQVYENDARLLSSDPILLVPSAESIAKLTSAEEDCPASHTTEYLPPIGDLDITVDIDTSLSPVFHLLVYYVGDNRETVADSQEIQVQECFKNKVEFSFGNKVQQPSLPTSIQIKSAPNSLCGIKAIDKSLSLLNNNDELTKERIFQKLKSLDNNRYYSSNPCYNDRSQPGLNNSLYRDLIPQPPAGFGADSYQDSFSSFQTSGFIVISDLLVFTRPCSSDEGYGYYGSPISIVPSGPGTTPATITGPDGAVRTIMLPPGAGSSVTSVKEVRDDFPETWLFEMEMTGSDGIFETEKQLPDTITEWLGRAVCINSNEGLGISNTTGITAFQAFFIDYTLPTSVIRGEEFVLVVSIFSYTAEALPISVSLVNSDGFTVTNNSIDGNYCIHPDSSVSLSINLKATKIGEVNITVLAETNNSSTVCGDSPVSSSYARDAIRKHIEVEAEGFPQESVINTLVCPSDNENDVYEGKITLSVPKDIVPDSSRAYMDFTGNVMGPAINDLNNLVSLPTGCGEQNMVKFTPNYIVLDYLQSIGSLKDDIKREAISNLITGYQQELIYRHYDGSFSAFGGSDSEGSMFLTAFVLRSFYQAKRYIYIDNYLLKDMQKWILSRQNSNGCFQDVGQIIDIGLEGGLQSDKSSGSITAYVLASLILSDFNNQTILDGGFACMEKNPPSNPYSQMLYAYAEALTGRNNQAKKYISEARQRLSRTESMESFKIVNGTESIVIETDAYAVLSTLKMGGTASDVLPYIRYLTNNLNPYGGFKSTQDTCVGLEALAQFAQLIYKDPLNIQVATTGGLEQKIEITEKNSLVVQRFKVVNYPNDVMIKAQGTGCGLIQTAIRYNTETPPEKRMFALNVKGECSFSGCKDATINVLVSYLPSGQKSGMSIVQIKLITGYVPDRNSISELEADQSNNILRVEVQNNMVICYFSEISNEVEDFSFHIEQIVDVKNAKPGTAKVYDYYANENSSSTNYTISGFNSSSNSSENELQ